MERKLKANKKVSMKKKAGKGTPEEKKEKVKVRKENGNG